MKKIKQIEFVNSNDSIKKAMVLLNKIPVKTLLVLNNNKLIGTLSDGDIRRGLVKGKNIDSNVSKICNLNFKYVHSISDKSKINRIFNSYNVPLIPVIDKNKKIIEIIYQNENYNKIFFKNNLVFILAGGEGKRLLPLTKKVPKPILKIGKISIIEIIFSYFKNSGYNNFLISLNYKKMSLKNIFLNQMK